MKINFDKIKDVCKNSLDVGFLESESTQQNGLNAELLKEFQRQGCIENSIYDGLTSSRIVAIQNNCRKMGLAIEPTPIEMICNAFGIRTSGPKVDKVSNFLSVANGKLLFAMYLLDKIQTTQIQIGWVEQLVSQIIPITEQYFKKLVINDEAVDREMGLTPPATPFPMKEIKGGTTIGTLNKYGCALRFSYEDVKEMFITQFVEAFVYNISRQLEADKASLVISTLINGSDGESNGLSADNTVENEVAGTLSDSDILAFISSTPDGYQITNAIIGISLLRKYWRVMWQLTNPQAQKGEVSVPFPVVTRCDLAALPSTTILGVAKAIACVGFTNDATNSENARNILNQTVDTTLWTTFAVTNLDYNGIGALSYTA